MGGREADSPRDVWAPTAKGKLPLHHLEQTNDSLRVARSPSASNAPPSPPPGASARCKPQISGEGKQNWGMDPYNTQL